MSSLIRILLPVLLVAGTTCTLRSPKEPVEGRIAKTINANWTFNYFPAESMPEAVTQPDYDDARWPAVALPHTWSTYETTGEIHPFIRSASEQDDPYWWYGWGCYRKEFSMAPGLRDKLVFIEFDGVQKYSRVYMNGEFVGAHAGGYTSFHFDVTKHINRAGDNTLVVLVNNRRNDPRHIPPMTAGNWDVYGGIYRDVRVVLKDKLHIPYQGSYRHEGGTFNTTPYVDSSRAEVVIKTFVKNEYKMPVLCLLRTTIEDPEGRLVADLQIDDTIRSGAMTTFAQGYTIETPRLWSPADPNVYKVVSRLYRDGLLTDQYESPLGIRWFHWDYEEDNLYINGHRMNILGTNRHQEYPWLGDAHPKWIARMDMYDIKFNLGHNFMRLTHYPNDKYLYHLADSFGIAMVEEVPNIKSIDFDEQVQEQHVREMIRRDRNHPSILFWSMGNETTDAADSKWAWEEDTTRIIHLRKGHDGGDYVQHTHENLDLEHLLRVTVRGWFDEDDAPDGFTSTPVNGQHTGNETWQHRMARVRGGSVRGLLGDNCNAWLYEDHGADREYLHCILKHINPKGWVDMYRQPKYLYWLTRAYYTDIPTVFIHPHFWREQYVGERKDIVVDSNCEEVALYVNGRRVGTQQPSSTSFNTVTFEEVLVEEGALKAVGKLEGEVHERVVHMPGAPAKIILSTQQRSIPADRSGIAILEADIVDAGGHRVFDARNTLRWTVEGPGRLLAPEVYESDIDKHEEMEGTGYTVVPVCNLVRSTAQPGTIRVTVSSEGLDSAYVEITSVTPPIDTRYIIEKQLRDEGRVPVERDPDHRTGDVVINELLTIRENHEIKGEDFRSYRKNIRAFIEARNRFNTGAYGYEVLLDELAQRLVAMDGELIADDYNFMIGQYNLYYELEKAVKRTMNAPEEARRELLSTYADQIIVKSNPVDLETEKQKIKNMSF